MRGRKIVITSSPLFSKSTKSLLRKGDTVLRTRRWAQRFESLIALGVYLKEKIDFSLSKGLKYQLSNYV